MRTFTIATAAAAALFCFPAFTQDWNQSSTLPPDFSGLWSNPYLYGIELPLSGPGPVVNTARRRQTLDADGRRLTAANAPPVSDNTKLVGDYTNPILRPEAAEVVTAETRGMQSFPDLPGLRDKERVLVTRKITYTHPPLPPRIPGNQ